MKEIICSKITGEDCEYSFLKVNDNEILEFLIHYNEHHDPTFVPRCKDDLLVEYKNIIDVIDRDSDNKF